VNNHYRVEIWTPLPHMRAEHYGDAELTSVHRFKTEERARRFAARALGRLYVTEYRYHRPTHDDTRFATIHKERPRKRHMRSIERCIEPEKVLVPSVGELGYW
jgi:hypothetical protein